MSACGWHHTCMCHLLDTPGVGCLVERLLAEGLGSCPVFQCKEMLKLRAPGIMTQAQSPSKDAYLSGLCDSSDPGYALSIRVVCDSRWKTFKDAQKVIAAGQGRHL